MTQIAAARRLEPADSRAVVRALDADPVQNVYLRSEVRLGSLRTGAWWGLADGSGELRSVMAGGALVVPWLGVDDDARPLAAVLDQQRRPQLMTGPREHVGALHRARHPVPPPREVRDPQPLMLLRRGELTGGPPAAGVRRGETRDLDRLTMASGAMHREEMGIDPLAIDPAGWRFRMATLVDRGWSFVWMQQGEVLFKAELSAWTPDTCQVQGVYTAPEHRGTGIGRAGMAAVCERLLREVPAVSLYVNHFNEPALRLYHSLGFTRVADFATLFF